MTDAVVSLRVYTGTNAGTESSSQTGIDLISVDNAVNSAQNRSDNKVAPGTNSFEKWLRLKVEAANGHTLTDFWIKRTDYLSDAVIIKMGVIDAPATPTASTSTVATTTMASGRNYFFDNGEYDTTGGLTRWLVLQEQVSGSSPSGALTTGTFTIGWSQS